MATTFTPIITPAKTVLGIVQAFARKKGLPVPTTIFSTSDAGALQFRELLQDIGDDLLPRTNWKVLMRTASWSALDAVDQGDVTVLFPEEMKSISEGSFWNISKRLPIEGPLTEQEWIQIQALVMTPYGKFRIAANRLLVYPAPTLDDSLSLAYKSGNWLMDVAGAGKAFITADTDVPLFDRNLFSLGLDFFWKRLKELPYVVEQDRYEAAVEDAASQNTVGRRIFLSGGSDQVARPGIVVPTTNWGQ